jgi:hypothetical protein
VHIVPSYGANKSCISKVIIVTITIDAGATACTQQRREVSFDQTIVPTNQVFVGWSGAMAHVTPSPWEVLDLLAMLYHSGLRPTRTSTSMYHNPTNWRYWDRRPC